MQTSRIAAQARRVDDPVIARLMNAVLARPNLLSLAAGFTDNALLPAAPVARAAALLETSGEARAALQYGRNQGRPGLAGEIVRHLASVAGGSTVAAAEEVVVTNGSQQALYLLTQALCDPGDLVLVQAPSYFVYLELARGLGCEVVSWPQESGSFALDAAGLRRWFRRPEAARCRLLYLNGYHANASGHTLALAEKLALAEVMRELPEPPLVLEDNAYRELGFDGGPPPPPSVAELPEWAGLPWVYCGTFTKPLATGLKVGYAVVRDPRLRHTLLKLKGHQDFGTAHYPQAIVETILREGWFGPHLEAVRAAYAAKAAVLDGALRAGGLEAAGWRWQRPAGGLLLWAEGPDGLDTGLESPFCQACLEADVLYVPGELCFAEPGRRSSVRLSFGALPADRLAEAGTRFAAVARRFA